MTSVADRYARSITSSHLEVTEFTGDVDALIAAGWVREGLATTLWRLRVEFDGVDKRVLRSNSSMTDRLLVLMHMKTLPAARNALGGFVRGQALQANLELSQEERVRMCARILNQFLDQLCPACHGVRNKTIPGTGRLSAMPCDACEGSGKQRLKFTGNTDAAEVKFTEAVLADLDRKMDRVGKLMKRFLRNGGAS